MTELVQRTGTKTPDFIACGECSGKEDGLCAVGWDKQANDCIGNIMESDGIVLSPPMYFTEVPLIPIFRPPMT